MTSPYSEFKDEMAKIALIRDQEERHVKADDLMCQVLSMLGYEDGVQIFLDMNKWYA